MLLKQINASFNAMFSKFEKQLVVIGEKVL